jgi:biotin transport system substrate-specific component
MPGTPVPMTLQLAAVLLAGLCLPAGAAIAAMLLYIAAGLVGLPAWSPGSAGLLGVTGGYIFGFVFAAAAVSTLRDGSRHWTRVAAAVFSGVVVVLAAGVVWQAVWLGISLGDGIRIGLLPFVPKAIVEACLLISGFCAFDRMRSRTRVQH